MSGTMHIADGHIDLTVAAVFVVASLVVLAVAARRADGELDGARVPLLGVTAAGIFAAQMLNWPIPGGTSAHFVGGALAALMLGPHLGALAMATVVGTQALVFGDGGVTALGANLFNMAIVQVYVGYAVYRLLQNHDERVAVFAAGWLGITVAAVIAGLQVGLSLTMPWTAVQTVTIMGVGHALLGIVEGGITLVVYQYIADARPDILPDAGPRGVAA
jgi:cobalt/nickel transport system permease protein